MRRLLLSRRAKTLGMISRTWVNMTRNQYHLGDTTMYHNSRSLVAAARTVPEPSGPRSVSPRALAEEVRLIAGCLYLSTPRLSPADRQFLMDLRREECRYPMKAVERLASIAQQSVKPEHREAFAELIRKYSTPQREPMCVIVASNLEQEANGPLDIAMRAFEQDPSLANKERAKEAGRAQLVRTREVLDALEAFPVYA